MSMALLFWGNVAFFVFTPVCLLASWFQGALSVRADARGAVGALQFRAGSADPPRAHAACGVVQGTWEEGNVAAYRGLPYGAAPVGSRRFKPADPAPCWSQGTVFDASKNGNICFQSKGGGPGESEDCLNLNVFAPAGASDLPVFVWIYGGSNVEGSVKWFMYGPIENIVRQHPCILVAMNYRTGTFGFLALKELSAVDPRGVSGNAGITDQQLAMRWVQENIRAFGGNPGRVTLIGQSSGATNILAHLASRSSRGLFHGAIVLSPSANITMDRARKEAQDQADLVPHTPCANVSGSQLLECLYTADAGALDAALTRAYSLFEAFFDYPTDHRGMVGRMDALPYVDGQTISMPLLDALAAGLNDVPLLLQSEQEELAIDPANGTEGITQKNLSVLWHKKFDGAYGPAKVEEILQLYKDYSPEYAVYALDSDTGMACALRQLAMAARTGFRSPVYWATVTSEPSTPVAGMRMSFHSWDFTAAVQNFENFGYEPSPRDVAFGERILGDWYQLLSNGSIPEASGYRRVHVSAGDHVSGSTVGNTETEWHADFKGEVCRFWEALGVDQRWWWIN